MGKYAVVSGGVVENIIVWDGDTQMWQPPEGAVAVLIPQDVFVDIGYQYDGETFKPSAT